MFSIKQTIWCYWMEQKKSIGHGGVVNLIRSFLVTHKKYIELCISESELRSRKLTACGGEY